MKEKRRYWFNDPTAYEAITRADSSGATCSKPEPEEASPEDLQKYQGIVFEPKQLITDRQLRRLKYRAAVLSKSISKESSNL